MIILDWITAPFIEYSFMRRALVGASALSLGGAPLGIFLVLRRMSLIGDAMSHAILPGVAIGFLISGLSLTAMTIGGVVTGLTVAWFSGAVARLTPLREDASFAAFYLISLGLGVMLVSLRGSNTDLIHVLFGTVLALDKPSLELLTAVSTITLFSLAVIYRLLVIECLDPGFLKVNGGNSLLVHVLFLTLVVLNLVAGFQVLGTLMVVGLMMLPAASARFWLPSIASQMTLAATLGILSSLVGLLASYYYNIATSPSIILSAGLFYLVSVFFGPHGGLLRG